MTDLAKSQRLLPLSCQSRDKVTNYPQDTYKQIHNLAAAVVVASVGHLYHISSIVDVHKLQPNFYTEPAKIN